MGAAEEDVYSKGENDMLNVLMMVLSIIGLGTVAMWGFKGLQLLSESKQKKAERMKAYRWERRFREFGFIK